MCSTRPKSSLCKRHGRCWGLLPWPSRKEVGSQIHTKQGRAFQKSLIPTTAQCLPQLLCSGRNPRECSIPDSQALGPLGLIGHLGKDLILTPGTEGKVGWRGGLWPQDLRDSFVWALSQSWLYFPKLWCSCLLQYTLWICPFCISLPSTTSLNMGKVNIERVKQHTFGLWFEILGHVNYAMPKAVGLVFRANVAFAYEEYLLEGIVDEIMIPFASFFPGAHFFHDFVPIGLIKHRRVI